MATVFKAYLQLCRPANLPTAAADVLAGLAISGLFGSLAYFEFPNFLNSNLLLLVFASVFLYAGGVVLNDVYDFELDKKERPERPIPSGRVAYKNAMVFGYTLLLIGIICAFLVKLECGVVAMALATAILSYDKVAKHHSFLGPLNMGICRGLNLFMGILYVNQLDNWLYALIPVVFIFAVTLISRGEVHGKNKLNIVFAGLLYTLVITAVIVLNYFFGLNGGISYLFFIVLFALMVFLPLIRAYVKNTPQNIKKSVKAGVLSIVLLDAAMAVGFTSIAYGIAILLLLPLSILLAKKFAVT